MMVVLTFAIVSMFVVFAVDVSKKRRACRR